MIKLLWIGLGGFLGSISRYGVYQWLDKPLSHVFPHTTLTVNIVGSLILGVLYGITNHSTLVSDHVRLFLAVGFCGSFTTFSTFALDSMVLLNQQQPMQTILYISLNVLLCLGAVYLGNYLALYVK